MTVIQPSWNLAAEARDALANVDLSARTTHELVELRAVLSSQVDAIDAQLRAQDGRNTAGAETLRRAR